MPDYPQRFGRKPFNKGGNDRFSSAPKTMYKAQCSNCNTTCEVPFRPNGKKPVFCKDCFVKDESPRSSYPQKREYSPRPSFQRDERPARDDRSMEEVKRELQGVNDKLEQLIRLMSKPEVVKAPAKKVAKKAAKK